METTNEKAMTGIKHYLERRGMQILEEGWAHGKDKVDFVVTDDGELVFIDCSFRRDGGDGFETEHPNRKALERVAAAYLTAHADLPESLVRFDIVSMLILNDGKALIRHHRNAIGTDEV